MILIINTSGNGLEFVLGAKHKSIETTRQSLELATATGEFMRECGAKWSDLTAIGVVIGPGSFTGIRLGIAYAKGLAMGLNIPVIGVSTFELYLNEYPDAFVAIDSGRNDLFVAAHDIAPCTMDISEIETRQMSYPRTVGHKPFDLMRATKIVADKIAHNDIAPVVPMYLRPSYAEENAKC